MTTAPTIADPIQAMLDRLDGVRTVGNGKWMALCPSHDDHIRSLSIGIGDTQPVVFQCMAGCDNNDILAAINLTWGDILGPSPNGQKRERRTSRPAAYQTFELAVAAAERQTRGKHSGTWNYHRANGDEHFRVARFDLPDGKTFRPFHHTARGLVQADPPGKLPLYCLPELLAADAGSIIYAFEGEKCQDAGRALGFTATTSAHGCKSPEKSDWTPLAGRRVVILPDDDSDTTDAGRKYAQTVASILTSLDPPASVKILELPDLPTNGGDIIDFIEDRRMNAKDDAAIRAEIEALAEQVQVWEPATGKTEAKSSSPLISVCMADVQPEQIKWLWPHRFPLGKFSVLAGMQGQGKSFATLDMSARISTGTPWPDQRDQPIEVGSTIILSLEDGLGDTIRPRLDAMSADVQRIHAIKGVRVVDDSGERTFNVTRDVFLLEKMIDKLGDVRLVIVDPLTGYLGGQTDAYRDNEVRAALAPLGDLATRTGVSIIGVMHLRKSSSDQAMFRVLGSVAFTAYARACWLIGDDNEEPGCKLMLPVKLNVSKAAPGLRFEIIEPGRVVWSDQPVDTTAEDMFAAKAEHPDEAGPKVVAAAEWLEQALANGAQCAKELKKQASENCITPRTLDRAKARLGVVASNEGVFGQAWYWTLPEPKPPLRERQP